MNPILCVTEFTEQTIDAARVSAALGRRWGSRVVLVASVDEREIFPFRMRARLAQDDWRRLAQEARLLRGLGFDFEEEVVRGGPDDSIAALAWNSDARLVVLGGAPCGRIDHWALGSLAEEIADTCRTPLLAIRSAGALEQWLAGERTLNVRIGLDPAARADAVLHRLDEWAALGSCRFSVSLLAYPEVSHTGAEEPPPDVREPQFRPERELREWLDHELTSRGIEVAPLRAAGHDETALIAGASESRADVLVVESHPRPDHPLLARRSLARGVLRHAPMNVLCVPETAVQPPAASLRAATASAMTATGDEVDA